MAVDSRWQVRTRVFLRDFILSMVMLPRQARDKHSENHSKGVDGSAGPRTEVVHQVENQYSCDTTQGGGGCCSSMRMGAGKRLLGGRHFLLKMIILPRQARDKHRNS